MLNEYDPELVKLQYYSVSAWHDLAFATVTYAASYNPDKNKTLILGSETLTFSLSGAGSKSLLFPLRTVRLMYAGIMVGSGYFTVDSYRRVYTTDPNAERAGKDFRTEATCSAVSAYAGTLSILVTYDKERPAGETAKEFIEQWCTVDNWPT